MTRHSPNSAFASFCAACLFFGCAQGLSPSSQSGKPPAPPPTPLMPAVARARASDAPVPVAPSCVPPAREGETAALHQLVSEYTEWKAPAAPSSKTQNIKILGFNDFHGQLSPPPAIEGRSVGGAAVLASYFRAAAKGFENTTLALHAGDLIGASPPASALHQDEPTIEFLGTLLGPGCSRRDRGSDNCHVVASLGNHEFDEGQSEFQRIVDGGNHARGPYLGHKYEGAPFEYIGANVRDKRTGKSIVAPYVVKNLAGTRIALVGAVLRQAPVFLLPSGIKNLDFEEETTAINTAVDSLSKQGIHAVVVVIHQGGQQCFASGVPRDEHSVAGPIVDIVRHLHPEVDLVVTGHTHSVINALLPNSVGRPTLVTQAFHAGTGFADIDLTIDTSSFDVIASRARIVTPWADVAPGNTPDPQILAAVQKTEDDVKARTSRAIGIAETTIHASPDEAGNSELGNLIVDAQREAAGVDMAFTTPSWVRGDIERGSINWGDLFRVQPFGNQLMKLELTGQQVVELLNQQWAIEDHPRILHAAGLTYQWDPKRPPNDRVVDVQRNGKPLDRKQRFSVVVNEYLAEGGDAFSLLSSRPRRRAQLADIDALERYVKKHSPISADLEKRIKRLP